MNKSLLTALLLFSSQGIVFSMSQKQLNGALNRASKDGDTGKVRDLIQAGAEVNSQDNLRNTPLHWAAMRGHTEIVKLLLKKDANVKAQGLCGWIPLHWAAYKGSTKAVKLLLDVCDDINAQDDKGRTPLHQAARRGNSEIAKLLLDVCDINAQDLEGNTPLHWAAIEGYNRGTTEVAKLLLEAGADSSIKCKDGKTALEKANDNQIKVLLEIKEKERKGELVNYHELLIEAINTDNLVVAQYVLLKVPLNVGLTEAVLNRRASVVKYLLSNILWSQDILTQAFQLAKESYSTTHDKVYQEIGRMLLQYLQILGPQGRISKKGLAIPLPDELKQIIATYQLAQWLV